MISNLGLNPEFEKAKAELANLSTCYAGLLTDYDEMSGTVRAELETAYMMNIGRKEYQLFSLQIQVLHTKREISIYQAAKNAGRQITRAEVKRVIDAEMADYQEQLATQLEKLKLAEALHLSPKMSREETSKIRKLYHNLAKILHPDINPTLPDKAKILWLKIVEAYRNWNWNELNILADMTYDMLERKEFTISELDSMTIVQQQIAKLKEKIKDIKEKMKIMREKPPFTYEKLLGDAQAIAKRRQELDDLRHHTEDYLDELLKLLDDLRKDYA